MCPRTALSDRGSHLLFFSSLFHPLVERGPNVPFFQGHRSVEGSPTELVSHCFFSCLWGRTIGGVNGNEVRIVRVRGPDPFTDGTETPSPNLERPIDVEEGTRKGRGTVTGGHLVRDGGAPFRSGTEDQRRGGLGTIHDSRGATGRWY